MMSKGPTNKERAESPREQVDVMEMAAANVAQWHQRGVIETDDTARQLRKAAQIVKQHAEELEREHD